VVWVQGAEDDAALMKAAKVSKRAKKYKPKATQDENTPDAAAPTPTRGRKPRKAAATKASATKPRRRRKAVESSDEDDLLDSEDEVVPKAVGKGRQRRVLQEAELDEDDLLLE
jgi:hypothetical protein